MSAPWLVYEPPPKMCTPHFEQTASEFDFKKEVILDFGKKCGVHIVEGST